MKSKRRKTQRASPFPIHIDVGLIDIDVGQIARQSQLEMQKSIASNATNLHVIVSSLLALLITLLFLYSIPCNTLAVVCASIACRNPYLELVHSAKLRNFAPILALLVVIIPCHNEVHDCLPLNVRSAYPFSYSLW